MNKTTKPRNLLIAVILIIAAFLAAGAFASKVDATPRAELVQGIGTDRVTFWDVDGDGAGDVSVFTDDNGCVSKWFEIGDDESSTAHMVDGCMTAGVIAQQAANELND